MKNKNRMKEFTELLEYPSSMVVVCCFCGANAFYYGKPDEINKAATDFYILHDKHRIVKKPDAGS